MKNIIAINQTAYDSLVCSSKHPHPDFVVQEIAWFRTENFSVLGVVARDLTDDDFCGIVMGKDEVGAYRWIDGKSSFNRHKDAETWLYNAMRWHGREGGTVFPQGYAGKSIDLLTPVRTREKQHPYFAQLHEEDQYLPAREILKILTPHLSDPDKQIAQEFQSINGFDARLWEIYLHAYFMEDKFFISREPAIDFVVEKYGEKIAVEAATVGRKADNPATYLPDFKRLAELSNISEEQRTEMAIRFGSVLRSKLQKQYWNLPQIAGCPLVFAVADFHADLSMLWSSTTLITYLYGTIHKHHYESGELVITPIKVKTHKTSEKEINSGFFFQTDADNISAVLSSSIATIGKFNRKGRQAGFAHPRCTMIRCGMRHDNDKNASIPQPYAYEVDESCTETWAEGLDMFHNPYARNPVPEHLFPTISHHRFNDGKIVSRMPEFYPYTSLTQNLVCKK